MPPARRDCEHASPQRPRRRQSRAARCRYSGRRTIPGVTRVLAEGDTFSVSAIGLGLSVLDVPGHAAGHIACIGRRAERPIVFCGDTLFTGGCGGLFARHAGTNGRFAVQAGRAAPRTLASSAATSMRSRTFASRRRSNRTMPCCASAGPAHRRSAIGASRRFRRRAPRNVRRIRSCVDGPAVRAAAEVHSGRRFTDRVGDSPSFAPGKMRSESFTSRLDA